MLSALWLLPLAPLLGFALLAIWGRRLSHGAISTIGVGSVAVSTAVAFAAAIGFIVSPPPGWVHLQSYASWFAAGALRPEFAVAYDPLAVVMTLVVTGVGLLIHIYSTGYMADDRGYSRFFAYLNLFVAMMLTLVLARNLLLLYLGWEGVGLCSYLLIGFWYEDPANGRAARKAFIVTRVGDTAMAIALFLILQHLGTLEIPALLAAAPGQWAVGAPIAVAVTALLLGGAAGKSAQLPLQTWLPDAMAGPTPVSALIHAATMVTAGVYLIARLHPLFLLAPPVMHVVAIVGAATLLLAGFSALTQTDIKRVLAWSTISQIGYMFLALGVGAWSAAIFHLMTHAFFKALLFMAAGAVIIACHHEQNLFRLGGLRTRLPVVFWTFLAGGAALSGFPLISAGFYSKDLILGRAFASGGALGIALWAAALLGALLTALYTFRMIFLTFWGQAETPVEHVPGRAITVPLVILAVLSVIGGFVETPASLGGIDVFDRFLAPAFTAPPAPELSAGTEVALQVIASLASLLGLLLAWRWIVRGRAAAPAPGTPYVGAAADRFWAQGWGFDALYDALWVRPYEFLARVGRDDVVDLWPRAVAAVTRGVSRALRTTQTGRLRWYLAGVALGAVVGLVVVWS